ARFAGDRAGVTFEAGGAISALLLSGIEDHVIDCAITASPDEAGRPRPTLSTTPEDVLRCAGTRHNQGPTLSAIGDAISREYSNIAVVGTPCQMQALRKMQNHPRFDFETYDLVKYAISTFCLGAFHSAKLAPFLADNGVNPEDIRGMRFEDFKLIAETSAGTTSIPENALFPECVRGNCKACSDYAGAFADISCGMIGSPEGWTTLIVRTTRGKELLDQARVKGNLETQPLAPESLDNVLTLTRSRTDWVAIEKVEEHAPDIRTYTFRAERIARAYRPGQFVVMWVQDVDFFPMGISRVDGDRIEITVQQVGPGTAALFALKEGDELGLRGPFGSGWRTDDGRNILVVGGGIGIAAVTTVVEQLKATGKNVWVAIGARNSASLIFQDRLTTLAPDCCCTTDDGSIGQKCFVTDPIADIVAENNIDLVLTCGPEVMMKTVFDIAESRGIEVQASLERFMKCAAGLCGTCCVGTDNNVTVCKDGPVFGSSQLRQFPQFGTYVKE
ncbi:MAG TPA: dihydroorotate dehydrogenase electron transfer subunit, partial [Candidatus Lokiarchaeia archaeon]|nr:dihydroorotate dehydrogenase electron transfer subunit [Candidatus Lokiarchaeia archaeon]